MTKAAILDAAEDLFATHGYAQITIARVAETANVAANTVYSVFGSKPALVAGLMERAASDPTIGRSLDQVDNLADAESIISVATSAAGKIVRKYIRTMTIIHDNHTADPLIADAANRADTMQRERLGRIAKRLADLGELRPGYTKNQAADILTYYLGQVSWRSLRNLGWSWNRAETWLANQVIATLLRSADLGARYEA